jgi:RimJ/RimL family protein N-acetyltransferase
MTVLHTSRLRLEPITDAHFAGLLALNSDPAVMRYITGKPDTPEDTRAMIERVKARWSEFGFSWWSLIEQRTGEIIGAGCIQHLGREPGNPLEIGWRLRVDKWGQGFASEAAHCMAGFAFETLEAESLYAVCRPDNRASSQVMERLGMHYKGEEVWYDMITSVYEITRSEWFEHCRAK